MPNKVVVSQDAVTRYVMENITAGRSADEITINEVHKEFGGRYERVRAFLENARVAVGAPRNSPPLVKDDAANEIQSASLTYLGKLQEFVKREDAERIEALESQIEVLTKERDAAQRTVESLKLEFEALEADLTAERNARRDQTAITENTASLSDSVSNMAKVIASAAEQISELQHCHSAGQKEVLGAIQSLTDCVQRIPSAEEPQPATNEKASEMTSGEAQRRDKRNAAGS